MKRFLLYIMLGGILASCNADDPTSETSMVMQKIGNAPYVPFSNGVFERPDTLRLLVIGNSFAQNAVGKYLNGMLTAAGLHYEIGLLHKDSASLQMHLTQGICSSEYYKYYIYDSEGRTEQMPNCSLEEAISSNDWNCISFQQASEYSGNYDSYTQYLPSLLKYCEYMLGPTFEILFHQTWAFETSYTGKKFAPYDYNQVLMYMKIMECSQYVMLDYNFDLLLPCGTAVQNARTTELLACPTSDGCHLSEYSGHYLAACVWYEAITGLDVRDIQYTPAKVSKEEQRIAQEAAHAAIINPYTMTPIK